MCIQKTMRSLVNWFVIHLAALIALTAGCSSQNRYDKPYIEMDLLVEQGALSDFTSFEVIVTIEGKRQAYATVANPSQLVGNTITLAMLPNERGHATVHISGLTAASSCSSVEGDGSVDIADDTLYMAQVTLRPSSRGQTCLLSIIQPKKTAGTVTVQNPAMSCGIECYGRVPSGQMVTLTAVPAPGMVFDHWEVSKVRADGNPLSIQVDRFTEVNAIFLPEVCPPDSYCNVPALAANASELTLNTIWGQSATDIWVGGKDSTGRGIIYYFNGAVWLQASSGETLTEINGLWANSTDVYAVGLNKVYTCRAPGHGSPACTTLTMNSLGSTQLFQGVSGSGNTLWLASYGRRVYTGTVNSGASPMLTLTSVGGQTFADSLRQIWAADGSLAFTVGNSATTGVCSTGSCTTGGGTSPDYLAVSGFNRSSVWASGTTGAAQPATILHSDGATWKTIPNTLTAGTELRGMFADVKQQRLWAIGGAGLLMHWQDAANPTTLTVEVISKAETATDHPNAVWAMDNDVWIAGSQGVIRHYKVN